MTGARQPLLRRLAIVAVALLLAACSQMGRQEPTVFKGQFSPSGRYYAYIYHSVFIFSHQRTGGRTVSNGSLTNYLQLVDTRAGRKLLAEPLKLDADVCRFPSLGAVGESQVLIACRDDGGKAQAPMVFSIAAQTVTLDGAAIRARNPGVNLTVEGADFYRRREQLDAFFVEAGDGRKYRLDPASGAAQPADGDFVRVDSFQQTRGRLPESLSEAGDGRRYIEFAGHGQAQRSPQDFLDPKYLVIDLPQAESFPKATRIDGGILVLSDTEKNSSQHKLLALLDVTTLATRWSTPLPQSRGDWANSFDTEQFVRQGESLLLANASQLLRIDLKSGKIVSDTDLLGP